MDSVLFVLVCYSLLSITQPDLQIGCFERWHKFQYRNGIPLASENNLVDCLQWCLNNLNCSSTDWDLEDGCFVNTKPYSEQNRVITPLISVDHYKKYLECKVADRECMTNLPKTTFTSVLSKYRKRTLYGADNQVDCILGCRMSINCLGVEWNTKTSHCLCWNKKPLVWRKKRARNIFTVTIDAKCYKYDPNSKTQSPSTSYRPKETSIYTSSDFLAPNVTVTTGTSIATANSSLAAPHFTATPGGTVSQQCIPQIRQTNSSGNTRQEKLYKYGDDSYYSRHEDNVCFVCFPAITRIQCAVHCTSVKRCSRFIFQVINKTCCMGL